MCRRYPLNNPSKVVIFFMSSWFESGGTHPALIHLIMLGLRSYYCWHSESCNCWLPLLAEQSWSSTSFNKTLSIYEPHMAVAFARTIWYLFDLHDTLEINKGHCEEFGLCYEATWSKTPQCGANPCRSQAGLKRSSRSRKLAWWGQTPKDNEIVSWTSAIKRRNMQQPILSMSKHAWFTLLQKGT